MSDIQKVGLEVAQDEFERFCESMDIDHDTSTMKQEDADGFEEQKEIIVRAIQSGRLVINEDGEPEYTPKRDGFQNALTFREPSAANYMAMDRQKAGNDVGKMIALMDSITKSAPGTCSKLKGPDFKVARAITTLFMA